MSTFDIGAKGYLTCGTAADPTGESSPLVFTNMLKNVTRDGKIDLPDQTAFGAGNNSKSCLYGLNDEDVTIEAQWEKTGATYIGLGDIMAAGSTDADFNVTMTDYPFGNTSGNLVVTRQVKIKGRSMKGGTGNIVDGTITFQRSGEVTESTV